MIAITQAEAEEPEVKEVKEPQVAATVQRLMIFHDQILQVFFNKHLQPNAPTSTHFNLLLRDNLQGWCSTEELKEEPQVPGVVEALAL